jgi:hypothetical protein
MPSTVATTTNTGLIQRLWRFPSQVAFRHGERTLNYAQERVSAA